MSGAAQPVQKVKCQECGEWKELPFFKHVVMQLIAEGYCADCFFWIRHARLRDDPNSVRYQGEQYFMGADDADYRGFDGASWCVDFKDGRVVETRNLNYIGIIPENFRDRLPDNVDSLLRTGNADTKRRK